MEEQFDNPDYEQGYQDGQADAETEFLNELRNSVKTSVTIQTGILTDRATVTFELPMDSKVYSMLVDLASEKITPRERTVPTTTTSSLGINTNYALGQYTTSTFTGANPPSLDVIQRLRDAYLLDKLMKD